MFKEDLISGVVSYGVIVYLSPLVHAFQPLKGEDEVIEDDTPDPDREVDNLTQLRKAAGLPDLIGDDLPSSNATKMMSLFGTKRKNYNSSNQSDHFSV